MSAFIVMLKNVIVFVLLAIPGFLLVKSKQLKAEQSGALSKLLTFIGLPFLTLNSTLNLSLNADTAVTLLVAAAIGIAYTVLVFFLSAPATAMERNEKTRGMMRFASTFSNNGFLGLPLATAVFGVGSPVITVVVVFNIITNIFMYTLGVYLISGDRKTISLKKALVNPILIGFAVGILLNLFKVKDFLPEVASYSTHFSSIVTPLSMTILGMKMGAVRFKDLFGKVRLYFVAAIKLLAVPLLITGTVYALNAAFGGIFTDEFVLGTFIAFSMPTAGMAPTFSDQYDGDTASAVSFTLGTTILSVATIPVLYWLITLIL